MKTRAVRIGMEQDFGLEVATDGFCGARLLEGEEHSRANLRETLPLFGGVFSESASNCRSFREERQVHAFRFAL